MWYINGEDSGSWDQQLPTSSKKWYRIIDTTEWKDPNDPKSANDVNNFWSTDLDGDGIENEDPSDIEAAAFDGGATYGIPSNGMVIFKEL